MALSSLSAKALKISPVATLRLPPSGGELMVVSGLSEKSYLSVASLVSTSRPGYGPSRMMHESLLWLAGTVTCLT